jgi:hypothetical protein
MFAALRKGNGSKSFLVSFYAIVYWKTAAEAISGKEKAWALAVLKDVAA